MCFCGFRWFVERAGESVGGDFVVGLPGREREATPTLL